MGCDKEDVSPKLDIVLIAPRETGAGQRHLLDEHGEAIAGGGEVQLQVTLEQWPPSGGGVGENHRGGCQ